MPATSASTMRPGRLLGLCKNAMRTEGRPAVSYRSLNTGSRNQSIEERRSAFRASEGRMQNASALEQNRYRRWKTGEVYAPHDLSSQEQKKWKVYQRPTVDAFDVLQMNPISLYKNFSVMSEYISEMGRIKHSRETGLRPKNQRKIAKAIRRSIGLGLMPSTHIHPEIIRKNMAQKMNEGKRF